MSIAPGDLVSLKRPRRRMVGGIVFARDGESFTLRFRDFSRYCRGSFETTVRSIALM